MRVFISHASQDKPAVEALASALGERGFDVWLDKWEIRPGDDIVVAINDGLQEADAGLIVFSEHSRASRWVEAETSYLTYARIQEGKALIPIEAGAGAFVPPLLRPLARRGIEEIDAIADALRSRTGAPPAARRAEEGRGERVLVRLERAGEHGLSVEARLGGELLGKLELDELPRSLLAAHAEFLRGFRTAHRRDPVAATRASLESKVAELGRQMRGVCLPGDAEEAVAQLIQAAPLDTTVELLFEADDAELLGLPFESLRLADDLLLVTHPKVVMWRRPMSLESSGGDSLAGPLKVLVAVGAPDEGQSAGVVLDQERELQNLLDAVEEAQRREQVEVRILEVGHPAVIGASIERDAYHVLHLSCHGLPGELELEDEEGRAVRVTAEELLEPMRGHGRPLPLVFLNSCHGGVVAKETASMAESLLRAGVPCVIAMQTSVSDHFATELARSFYEHLARMEPPIASRALAAARRELEQARSAAVQQGAALPQSQPEYATPALFVAGDEGPLANFSLDGAPLRERPVHEMGGRVPQLRIDDLIGRRRELRETLRVLRSKERRYAGVLLTGIGGVGKSALAGRAMRRLAESRYAVATHVGRFELQTIALAVGEALLESGATSSARSAERLADAQLEDGLRIQLLCKVLAEEPLVLVLDDFEKNLTEGGGAYLDTDVQVYVETLAGQARRGRMLLTCRYPVPGLDASLRRVPVGPLSGAESRKLIQRLERLRGREPSDVALVLRVIGGHPRMLEFLDALLRGGQGRLALVTEKLREVARAEGLSLDASSEELEEAVRRTLALGARSVFLDQLLELAREAGAEEVLLQAAVSNLPISEDGLAHMLAGEPTDGGGISAAIGLLVDLSLVHRFPDGELWVHRWTAEGLATRVDQEKHRARSKRAGNYRWWRVGNESRDLGDAVEAVRNDLAGGDFNSACHRSTACFAALRRSRQSSMIATLASEVLESLPVEHEGYAAVVDAEGQANLVLGFTDRALALYEKLLDAHVSRAADKPDRADYQRDLSVSYNKVGDLYGALGQGEKAGEAYQSSLGIAERLAKSEPDRADYQRDLSVSYERMGDLYGALGQGEKAGEAYQSSLEIRERLAKSEPDRADYQRDLSVSYERMGDLYGSAGSGGEGG